MNLVYPSMIRNSPLTDSILPLNRVGRPGVYNYFSHVPSYCSGAPPIHDVPARSTVTGECYNIIYAAFNFDRTIVLFIK